MRYHSIPIQSWLKDYCECGNEILTFADRTQFEKDGRCYDCGQKD